MKRNFVIAALFALSFLVPNASFGQYAEQALRLSNLSYGGTARFTGMGGAFGAIGGDFTTLSINPAGIGTYKKSEFSFTPLVYNTRSFSEYFGAHQQEFSARMNLNNAGFIFAAPITKSVLKTIQFGLGCTRLANFNNSIYFEGFNNSTSFVGSLAPIANQAYKNHDYDIDRPFYVDELAGAVNLLYQNGNNEWIADKYGNVNQSAWLRQEGGIDEMVFTFGGNLFDQLYFGATLGVPFMSYRHVYQYDEWDPVLTTEFKSMRYEEIYESDASGVNGKFGVIYKPVPFLRVGAAIHTPTYYWLIQESEVMTMNSAFKDSTQWNRMMSTQERQFEYSQTTPMRLIGSLAFVIGNIATISADYEWVDHSMNTLRPSRNNVMSNTNWEIRDAYGSQHIIRTGAELHYNNFFLRGGYGWYSSPFQSEKVNDMSLNTWSLGAGFRAGAFGLDFAFQNARSQSKYYPYVANPSPFANMTDNANSYLLTLSYRY